MKWRNVLLPPVTMVMLIYSQPAWSDEPVSCEALYQEIPHDRILDLLDPAAPSEHRVSVLEAYERLSKVDSCPEFGYTLGQLYRHGDELPGNLVGRDIERARPLIKAMAEDGYLPAYADLAEMEMRHGSYRKAMQWTQVYLYFVKTLKRPFMDADEAQYHRSAYNGHLLTRAEVVWGWQKPAVPRKRIREDFNAYLEAHGKAVEQRMRERMEGYHVRASAQNGPGLRLKTGMDDCRLLIKDRIGAATASWIAEVLPSGQMERVLLENFVPTVVAVDRLRQECIARYRFEPFEGEQPRTVRLSVTFGSPEGAAIRR